MARELSRYSDDVELTPFAISDADEEGEEEEGEAEPDFPLPLPSAIDSSMDEPLLQPRWLTQRTKNWRIPQPRWLTQRTKNLRIPQPLIDLVQPRFTWRYILCATILLYVFYCFIRGSPLLASRLPKYSGPYGVGAIDVEIPLERPLFTSDAVFKKDGQRAFALETVLFTIYYPIAKGSKSKKAAHRWIPKPISLTAEGYAKFAGVNNFITRPIFTFALWAIAGGIEIPAQVDMPIASPTDAENKRSFPIMVFSHGMASSRTDYTHYLGEMASQGYVLAAIEHRDGSCPGSLLIGPDGKEHRVLHFGESELESKPPMDTPRLKKDQLNFREAEIVETISALERINSGRGDFVHETNLRKEGSDFAAWKDRLDFSHLVIGGHSYGATGALQALKGATSQSRPAVGGIILDPGKSSGPMNHDINVPILVIHSNSWSSTHSIFNGRPHFDYVRDLVLQVRDRAHAAWFLTSLGTSHPSVTDAPLIEPMLLSWTTGSTINVVEGLREYVKASIEFFKFVEKGEKLGILAENVTHEQYGKWISKEREDEFPKEMKKYWEVHVGPEERKKKKTTTMKKKQMRLKA